MTRLASVKPILWLLAPLALAPPLAAQCPDGSAPPCTGRNASPPPPTSVAVLYFESQSSDSNDAYLSEGITEEIIQTLTGVSRLKVQNRHSVSRFRSHPTQDLAAIGRTLGVSYVVTGTIRRSGSRVRVSAELTRAVNGIQVWGERYDRGGEDLFAIQEDIGRQVATGIVGRLLPDERALLATRPTKDPEAYDHYLRGNFYLARREFIARAIEEYRAALRLDPSFARALGRLSYTYALALETGESVPGVPRDSILSVGLALADQALSRDPRDPDAWLGLGYLRARSDPIRYAGASEAMQRSLLLDSSNAEGWHQYGSVLSALGEDSAAASAFRHALALDSTRGISWIELSWLSTMAHRYDESLRLLQRAVDAAPGSVFAVFHRHLVRMASGDTTGVRSDAEAFAAAGYEGVADLALARMALRSRDSAALTAARHTIIAHINSTRQPVRNNDADDVITILLPALLEIGERDRVLQLLESVEPKGRALWFWLRWPELDPLRDEPRFQRLVAEAGQ